MYLHLVGRVNGGSLLGGGTWRRPRGTSTVGLVLTFGSVLAADSLGRGLTYLLGGELGASLEVLATMVEVTRLHFRQCDGREFWSVERREENKVKWCCCDLRLGNQNVSGRSTNEKVPTTAGRVRPRTGPTPRGEIARNQSREPLQSGKTWKKTMDRNGPRDH